DAYVKIGKVEEAMAAWEKAISVDKENRLSDGVKKKLQEAREKQLRAKGERPQPKIDTKERARPRPPPPLSGARSLRVRPAGGVAGSRGGGRASTARGRVGRLRGAPSPGRHPQPP